MNISFFGLGYVGCVGSVCFAKLGHKVVGIDVSQNKVNLINEGRPTIIEKDIAELCREVVDAGRLTATTDAEEAVRATDISFVTVGTPSSKEGHLNLEYIYNVARQIGEALRHKDTFHTVVIRSTVMPGTNRRATLTSL